MDKLKVLALALFAAGLCASFALAGNGHGKGKGSDDSTSTGATTSATTTTTAKGHGKVTLCHRAGKHGKVVRITVGKAAEKAHLKHGDVLPDANGACPAPSPAPTTTAAATTTSP